MPFYPLILTTLVVRDCDRSAVGVFVCLCVCTMTFEQYELLNYVFSLVVLLDLTYIMFKGQGYRSSSSSPGGNLAKAVSATASEGFSALLGYHKISCIICTILCIIVPLSEDVCIVHVN